MMAFVSSIRLSDADMDELLSSHALSPSHLRQDAFDEFIDDRRQRLGELIERAMGKAVSQVSDPGEYADDDV